MTKEEIKKEIAECEEKLKSLRKELDKPEYGGKRWKPKYGESYFYIDSEHYIGTISSYDDPGYDRSYQIGNCFRAREEAEFAVERLKVIAELSDYAEGNDAMWDGANRHYWLYYNYKTDCIEYTDNQFCKIGVYISPQKRRQKRQ